MASTRQIHNRVKAGSALTTITPENLQTLFPADKIVSETTAFRLVGEAMERDDLRRRSIFDPAITSYEGNPLTFHQVSSEHTKPLVKSMANIVMSLYGQPSVTHLDLSEASSNEHRQAYAYEHIINWQNLGPVDRALEFIIASGLKKDAADDQLLIQSQFCAGLSSLSSSQFRIAILGERSPLPMSAIEQLDQPQVESVALAA